MGITKRPDWHEVTRVLGSTPDVLGACLWCKAATGYVAACGEARVPACKKHVGEACAVWLYDMGYEAVEVRKLEGARRVEPATGEHEPPTPAPQDPVSAPHAHGV
jgi:hypothetical protein